MRLFLPGGASFSSVADPDSQAGDLCPRSLMRFLARSQIDCPRLVVVGVLCVSKFLNGYFIHTITIKKGVSL